MLARVQKGQGFAQKRAEHGKALVALRVGQNVRQFIRRRPFRFKFKIGRGSEVQKGGRAARRRGDIQQKQERLRARRVAEVKGQGAVLPQAVHPADVLALNIFAQAHGGGVGRVRGQGPLRGKKQGRLLPPVPDHKVELLRRLLCLGV